MIQAAAGGGQKLEVKYLARCFLVESGGRGSGVVFGEPAFHVVNRCPKTTPDPVASTIQGYRKCKETSGRVLRIWCFVLGDSLSDRFSVVYALHGLYLRRAWASSRRALNAGRGSGVSVVWSLSFCAINGNEAQSTKNEEPPTVPTTLHFELITLHFALSYSSSVHPSLTLPIKGEGTSPPHQPTDLPLYRPTDLPTHRPTVPPTYRPTVSSNSRYRLANWSRS